MANTQDGATNAAPQSNDPKIAPSEFKVQQNLNKSESSFTRDLTKDEKYIKIDANQHTSPGKVSLSGSIGGLLDYIAKNRVRINMDQNATGQVVVTHDTDTVTLAHGLWARPVNDFRDVITVIEVSGTMKNDPDLIKILDISEKNCEPMALAKWIRANKVLFSNTTEWNTMYENLRDFSAKIEEVRENSHDDQRGSIKQKFERVLKEVPSWSIDMRVPLLYGMAPINMTFDIAFDSIGSNGVTAGLRNYDLASQVRKAKEDSMQATLATIREGLPTTPVMMK